MKRPPSRLTGHEFRRLLLDIQSILNVGRKSGLSGEAVKSRGEHLSIGKTAASEACRQFEGRWPVIFQMWIAARIERVMTVTEKSGRLIKPQVCSVVLRNAQICREPL